MLHLTVATVVFYALHSGLASMGVKRWMRERLGLDRWYRLAYTVVSVVLLAWVVSAYLQVPNIPLLPTLPNWMRVLGWSMMALGTALAMVAILRIGGAGFVGLVPERKDVLVRSGLHGHMRHPIYTGVVLAALGWLLIDGGMACSVVVSITFLYLPIGIRLEERKLIAVFGEDYKRYRREVPALFPDFRETGG